MKPSCSARLRPVALGMAIAAAMVAPSAMADTILFTDFDVSQGTSGAPAAAVAAPGTATSTPAAAPQPGDVRTMSVTMNSGENMGVYVDNGAYHYFQSSNQTFGSGKIVWNLGANCRDWTDAVSMIVRSGQDHPLSMTVTVDGQSTTRGLPDNNNVMQDFSFSINGDSCVEEVTLTVDGTAAQSVALDLDIDRISVVTEAPPPPVIPAITAVGLGASLIGLPLFAFGLARRRSRKQ